MHRAYQPITPANNMLLKKRWDISRYNAHRRKVSTTQDRLPIGQITFTVPEYNKR